MRSPIDLAEELLGQRPKPCRGGARFYRDQKLKVNHDGSWWNFSEATGGGLPALVRWHLGCDWPDAYKWLESRGWQNPRGKNDHKRAETAHQESRDTLIFRARFAALQLLRADDLPSEIAAACRRDIDAYMRLHDRIHTRPSCFTLSRASAAYRDGWRAYVRTKR